MPTDFEIHVGEPDRLVPARQEGHARVEVPYYVYSGTAVLPGVAEVRRRVTHHVRPKGKGEAPASEERHTRNDLILFGPDLPDEHKQEIHDKAAAVFKVLAP